MKISELRTDIDKKLGIVGAGGGIILFIYSIVILKSFTLQEIFLTVFFGCIVYLLCRKKLLSIGVFQFSTDKKNINPTLCLLNILFFGMLTIEFILWSRCAYSHSFIFLIIVSTISGILAAEIFLSNNRTYSAFILVKLLILGIILRAYPYHLYSCQPGADPIYHVHFIEQMLMQGHIPNMNYESYPMIHIITASLSQLTGLGVKDSFFFISIIAVLSMTFVFLIGKKLFNEKIGLLSVLILVVCASQITLGWWITAMTLGLGLLPMLIFLLWSSHEAGKNLTYMVFVLLVMIVVILTHPVPSTTVAIVLGLAWIIFYLLYTTLGGSARVTRVASGTLTVLFSTMLLGYWLYVSSFIHNIAYSIKSALTIDRSLVLDVAPLAPTQSNVWGLIWRSLPILLFMFLAIVGFLAIVHRNEAKRLPQIHYAVLCGCFAVFVSSMQIFQFYEALPGRWISFLEIFLAFFVVIGLLIITYSMKENRRLMAMSLLVMIFTSVMVASGVSAVVSTVPWSDKPRMVLSESEMCAAEKIYQLSESREYQKDMLYADTYVKWPNKYKKSAFTHLKSAGDIFLRRRALDGILLLRQELRDNNVLISASNSPTQEFRMDTSQYQSFIEGSEYHIFYDCGTVRALKNRRICNESGGAMSISI